jgi:hypothetical protein
LVLGVGLAKVDIWHKKRAFPWVEDPEESFQWLWLPSQDWSSEDSITEEQLLSQAAYR